MARTGRESTDIQGQLLLFEAELTPTTTNQTEGKPGPVLTDKQRLLLDLVEQAEETCDLLKLQLQGEKDVSPALVKACLALTSEYVSMVI